MTSLDMHGAHRPRHRVLFVQYGDFRAALRNFEAGGEETYMDQRKSVEFVQTMSASADVVVAAASAAPYDEFVAPGLRVIGIRRSDIYGSDLPTRLLDDVQPSLCVPRFPHTPLIQALVARGIRAFPCFADIFTKPRGTAFLSPRGLRQRYRNRVLGLALAAPCITAVGNHSLSASLSLRDVMGVDADRIVPWEWTRLSAATTAVGAALDSDRGLHLVYAGTLSEQKGVGDLLVALKHARLSALQVNLTLFGRGPDESNLRSCAEALPHTVTVDFKGNRPNTEVRACMQGADAVVVPSRHSYAEGLPNVIFEALAAGAPLVVTDHPAFRDRLLDGTEAVVVRAADPHALGAGIARLVDEPGLQTHLRNTAAATLNGLYVGRSWYELMQNFLDDPEDRTGWVRAASLAGMDSAEGIRSKNSLKVIETNNRV